MIRSSAAAWFILCEHNERGALGVVINKPMDITVGHLLERLNMKLEIPSPVQDPVMFGGPVQEDPRFRSAFSRYGIHFHAENLGSGRLHDIP